MNTQSKIVTLAALKRKLPALRRRRAKIAFTNGCFDIIHAGHIGYLEAAKKPGRILIVGLNSDRSVRAIKGRGRPILRERDRLRTLAGLACTDYVVMFNGNTPVKLIEAVRPDVLIKGADWKNKGAVGSGFVKSYGGKVEFIRYIPGKSTTGIIQRIARRG